jgi:hypothetical protein
MWDSQGGGIPVQPIYDAMRDMGLPAVRSPNFAASGQDAMREFWQRAGLDAIETRVIRIPVVVPTFDEYWDSSTLGIGPLGKVMGELTPATREEIKTRLRQRLPKDASGRVSFEAFANAAKGRVPAR